MVHEKMIKEEFKKQAKDFSNKLLTLNREEYLYWIINSLNLNKDMNVLDVAAGTGILSRAISPFVNQVTSIDISEDMIQEGIAQNQLVGIKNIQYQSGNVEYLPFDNDKFDLVISRFAFHHFVNPNKVIQEMKRVCKSSALVAVVDMISSEDEQLYDKYNLYERLRDPSHTIALKKSQFIELFKENGLKIITSDTVTVDVNVNRWLDLTRTSDEISVQIRDCLLNEINTNKVKTGMSPFLENGELMFKQIWLKIMGTK